MVRVKVSMILEPAYLVKTTAGEFRARVVSEWEGFTKLQTEDGSVLIVRMEQGLAAGFRTAMGAPIEADVIIASPQLFEIIAPANAAPHKTEE
jgi:hypothetical protein